MFHHTPFSDSQSGSLTNRIYGIDFTSAPRRGKPIVCAVADLQPPLLRIERLDRWVSFDPFEAWLQSPGSWRAGFDFPIGLPRDFLVEIGWPTAWCEYVPHVASIGKDRFVASLQQFAHQQPAGKKHRFRATDRVSSACSPLMIYGVPVAKMFWEGSTRLFRSELSILPCRPTEQDRSAVETYPATIARRVLGRHSYKAENRAQDSDSRRENRARLSQYLNSPEAQRFFGFSMEASESVSRALLDDFTGDCLDAVACAMLAAWSYRQPDDGLPVGVDRDEGWIVGPAE